MQVLNRIIDAAFIFDILINFRTTIKNIMTGDEIFDQKVIAITYLKQRFFIDLIAAIPLDSIIGPDQADGGDHTGPGTSFKFRII